MASIKYVRKICRKTNISNPPWYTHVRVRIMGLEMLIFRKILRTYLMDNSLFKLCFDKRFDQNWSLMFVNLAKTDSLRTAFFTWIGNVFKAAILFLSTPKSFCVTLSQGWAISSTQALLGFYPHQVRHLQFLKFYVVNFELKSSNNS